MKSFNQFLQQKLLKESANEKYPPLDDLSNSEYNKMKDPNQIKHYINQARKNKDVEGLLHLKRVANKAGHHDLVDLADDAINLL